MEQRIRFRVNAAKYTLAKLEGACMDGFSSTIGLYGFKELKLQKFLNMPIRKGIIRSETRLRLLTETLKGPGDEIASLVLSQSQRGYSHNTSPTQHQQVRPASSPVARDHWGIFELIIKESGNEGSDGKGRKREATFPSLSFSFPSLPARALRSFPSSLSRASHLSRMLASSPISLLSLEKAGGGGNNVSFRDWSIDPGVPAVSDCFPE